ncbi:hypothetical protein B296_00040869, partial [Ensete ventricosum]
INIMTGRSCSGIKDSFSNIQCRFIEGEYDAYSLFFHQSYWSIVSCLSDKFLMLLLMCNFTKVSVPVRPLVAMLGRVLAMDGSVRGSFMPFTTVMHQELICFELPSLHLDTLDLLIAVVKGVRSQETSFLNGLISFDLIFTCSQLLPHAANVARILTEYFRRATLPAIRIKLYSVMQFLLISMGVGMWHFPISVVNDTWTNPSQKPNMPSFPMGNRGATDEMDDEDDDDDLLNGWLGAGEEEQPAQGLNISMGEKNVGVDSTGGHEIIEGTQHPSRKHEVETLCPSKEENMVESDKMEQLNSRNNVMLDNDRAAPDEGEAVIRDAPGDEMAYENNDVSMSNTVPGEFSSNLGAPEELGTVSTATVVAVDASNSLDVSYKHKEPMLAYDSDSGSLESLPDIVDADPDTD